MGVQHQRATLAKLAQCVPVPNEVWARLRQSDPADGAVVRISRRPSELARLWSTTMAIPDVNAHATLARGVVRLRLTNPDENALAGFDAADGRIIERAPAALRQVSRTSNDQISRRLRNAFDPAQIFNRGILGVEKA
jgi:hypothetical protein